MTPIYFIKLIRESFVGSETVFTSGSCYQLYKILKSVFPNAKAYVINENHIVTRIGINFYDINGYIEPTNPEKFDKNNPEHIKISKNKFHGHIDYIQCPNCDELIKISRE